jgi:hypothetical protein
LCYIIYSMDRTSFKTHYVKQNHSIFPG